PTIDYRSASSTGTLSFKPAANQFGTATITVIIRDDGGTANGGNNTIMRTFTVTVTPFNDPPSFEKGPDVQATDEDSAQTHDSWASASSAGPANEAGQTLK